MILLLFSNKGCMVGHSHLVLLQFFPDQAEKIISSLKNSKASGVDMVDTYVLKLVKADIVPAVCHIINLSLQTNKFPSKWKIAKGCKTDPKNYRPVAILPILR